MIRASKSRQLMTAPASLFPSGSIRSLRSCPLASWDKRRLDGHRFLLTSRNADWSFDFASFEPTDSATAGQARNSEDVP